MAVIITRLRRRWSQSRKSRPFLPYSDVTGRETSNLNLLIKPTKKEESRRTEAGPFVESFTEAFLPSFHTAYPSVTTVEVALTRCAMKEGGDSSIQVKFSPCRFFPKSNEFMAYDKCKEDLCIHLLPLVISKLPAHFGGCEFDLPAGRHISRSSHISTFPSLPLLLTFPFLPR